MSESREQSRTTGVPGRREPSVPEIEVVPPEPQHSAWSGWVTFAGIALALVGVLHVVEGIVALVQPDHYAVTERGLVLSWSYTTWGWIHLILGLLVAFAGWGLLSGRTWARVVAITLAVLSAIANFLFIPYYPFWSLLIITLDVFVIWALAAHGGDLREPV